MSTNSTLTTSSGETMRALRQNEQYGPATIEEHHPMPQVESGTAVLKILYAGIISYTNGVYFGKLKYPYPVPITFGSSAIARVHKLPTDATSLEEGQLVLADMVIRSRDKPTDVFLRAVHEGWTEGSRKLMKNTVWRDGTFAEYAAWPLENVYALNEKRLCSAVADGGLGLSISDLIPIGRLLVPYGGLLDIGLMAGETIIVAPATGGFSGAAVHVALAMGAKVIAMGRNETALAELVKTFLKAYPPASGRLKTVPISGSVGKDVAAITAAADGTPIDCFFDISPPAAYQSSHFKAAILCLKHGARISLMGGQREDVALPYVKIMHWNMQMKGKWMYDREDVPKFFRLIENGNLKLGEVEEGHGGFKKPKEFKLDDWKASFDAAERGEESILAL